MKILQINTVSNSRSTGRIAEGIGKAITEYGWNSYIASGCRLSGKSEASEQIFIGSQTDYKVHALATRLTDSHGFFSRWSTRKFLQKAAAIKPDLVHLHNLHGYYMNLPLLFKFIKEKNLPVIWTLHDCWAFTGHCTHFEYSGCTKWQTHCFKCPETSSYPRSFVDGSTRNFKAKKMIYEDLEQLTICTPSDWLKAHVTKSFLGTHNIVTINNGIDVDVFKPVQSDFRAKNSIGSKKVILGVASEWSARKGLADFVQLYKILPVDQFKFVIVGISDVQRDSLPKDFLIVNRTESREQLAEIYSAADYFFNPTYEDTFPTTNIEALACGSPVITYRTGGSPETIDEETGWVLEQGDIRAVSDLVNAITTKQPEVCRQRAENRFNENRAFLKYIEIYKSYLS